MLDSLFSLLLHGDLSPKMEGAALSAPAHRTTQESPHPGVQAGLAIGRSTDTGADGAAPSIERDTG